MFPTVQAAVRYVQRGWHPIVLAPAKPGDPESGKRPAGPWRDRRPWTIEEIVQAFRGEVGIALDCGRSGLVVLDCDSREAYEFATKVCEPTHTIVETGGGGRHLYYKCPEGLQISNRVKIDGLGLDRRAHGGYVVAPPTKHWSGGLYRFLCDEGMPEYVPNWFPAAEQRTVSRLPDATESGDWVRYRARRYISKITSVAGQGGDAAAFKVAIALVSKFGLKPHEALEEMTIWNHYCASPPWPESRLRYKIAEAVKLSHRR